MKAWLQKDINGFMVSSVLLGLLLVTITIQGCAFLGQPTPETFRERAAVALTTVTTVRQTALTLLQAQKITPDDATSVQGGADQARAGIEVARQIEATNPQAAENRLSAAITGLTALQAYLESRK